MVRHDIQVRTIDPADDNKASAFLSSVNNFFKAKLMSQVTTIEEILEAHMHEYAVSCGCSDEDAESIEFHLELINHEFKFVPHNFFTYLLSEGIYVPLSELGENFIYRTGEGMYKFEADKNFGCFIPVKNLATAS